MVSKVMTNSKGEPKSSASLTNKYVFTPVDISVGIFLNDLIPWDFNLNDSIKLSTLNGIVYTSFS